MEIPIRFKKHYKKIIPAVVLGFLDLNAVIMAVVIIETKKNVYQKDATMAVSL